MEQTTGTENDRVHGQVLSRSAEDADIAVDRQRKPAYCIRRCECKEGINDS